MKRLKTGVPGLDKILGGGLFEKSTTLVIGPPGSGKTTLGLQFINEGITRYQESGIYVTFEQFPEVIYRDALEFGWDLKRYEQYQKLKVVFTSPEVLKSEVEKEAGLIDSLVSELEAQRIVIDPINHFQQLNSDPGKLRLIYNALINSFKRLGLTSLLTCEASQLFGDEGMDGESLAFIVDNILMLKFVEIESELQLAVLALKVRGSDHENEIRKLAITSKGINIETKFEGHEGILSGAPRRLVDEEFLVERGLLKIKKS